MVEPVSLSLGVVVAGFLVKAFEEAGARIGSAATDGLGQLLVTVRNRLHGESGKVLTLAEEAPDSPSRLKGLADALNAEVAKDPTFGVELEGLLGTLERAGLDRQPVIQQAWGDNIVQVADVQGSSITIQR